MFGGGAKKEKKPEVDESVPGEKSGSSKAAKEAKEEEDDVSRRYLQLFVSAISQFCRNC